MQARRRLYARPAGGRLLGLEPASAAAAVAGGEHQLAGLVVGQRAGLARRRAGLPGVLAGDGAKRTADERRLRRVGQADGAAALRTVASFARSARSARYDATSAAGAANASISRPAHQCSNRRHCAA